MQRLSSYARCGLSIVTLLLTLSNEILFAHPMERVDYWQKNYTELLPTEDPRAERAHDIFTKVLRAAGKRPGMVPRMFITKEDPLGISLPIALPDGGVILSKRVLDICYRDPTWGDDRLAFVVAHEIAHVLKDDFWHMQFFQAVEASKASTPQDMRTLAEIQRLAKSTDDVWAKELQADEHGIVYASLAGFNSRAVVTQDGTVNFFADWLHALDPHRLTKAPMKDAHPDPIQRAEMVKTRLGQILDKVEVFNVGLRFYQVGKYAKAIVAFQDFLQFFPSREVYHNLATSHHQLALEYYRLWKQDAVAFPFQLSLAIDPVTRANQITLRASDRQSMPADMFTEHLDKAIEHYQMALSLDPSYTVSYNNLGCALLTKGEVYKAIGTLQDALKYTPGAPDLLNNLGVAFLVAENPAKAVAYLHQAHEQAPSDAVPLFNLGKLAYEAGQQADAQRYWKEYLTLAPAAPWAEVIRQKLPTVGASDSWPSLQQPTAEHIMGIRVGLFTREAPRDLGSPREILLSIEQDPFTIALYPTGLTTLAQEEEILMVQTPEKYRGTSARGIMVGSPQTDLLSHYGRPSKILHTTQGESWLYTPHGIAFQLRKRKVASWLLF